MPVTYKGIELGKKANQYSVVEVSELVALYIKNHSDDKGEYRGSIQSALVDMFGISADLWNSRLRDIAKLIKYIGYRPGQDGNGNKIWRVPMEELLSGGVRVSKDIPDIKQVSKMPTADVKEDRVSTTMVNNKNKDIPDGLRRNIAMRSKKKFVCEHCNKEYSEIHRGMHMKQHFGELGELGSKLIEVIREYPDLTSHEYATLMEWPYTKVSTTMNLLMKKNAVERTQDGLTNRYKVKSNEDGSEKVAEERTEERTVKAKPKAETKSVQAEKPEIPAGVTTLTVIESKDGSFYYINEGKVYIVRLEEVVL